MDTVVEGGGRAEPSPSYAEALTVFMERLNAAEAEGFKARGWKGEPPSYIVSGRGRRYDRVSRLYAEGSGGGVFCFVEKETGKVWKPASFRGPKRNFPRGDIFALPERAEAAREDQILHLTAARW